MITVKISNPKTVKGIIYPQVVLTEDHIRGQKEIEIWDPVDQLPVNANLQQDQVVIPKKNYVCLLWMTFRTRIAEGIPLPKTSKKKILLRRTCQKRTFLNLNSTQTTHLIMTAQLRKKSKRKTENSKLHNMESRNVLKKIKVSFVQFVIVCRKAKDNWTYIWRLSTQLSSFTVEIAKRSIRITMLATNT